MTACFLWLQDSPDTNREQIVKLSVSIYKLYILSSAVKCVACEIKKEKSNVIIKRVMGSENVTPDP